MKKRIIMLGGALLISAWVISENYLELKLQRAETWLYISGVLLFYVSAGFCLLMKDLKKSLMISVACAAVMCVLSRGLIWTALPVVLMFWEYRCVTDRLEGAETAVHSIVFTALSAVYTAVAVAWILITGNGDEVPRRYVFVADIYVSVLIFAAFVFLTAVCERRKKREDALYQIKKRTVGKKDLGKKIVVRDPIGYKEMYVQCIVLFALSLWVCFAPGVLGGRYTLRMTVFPWLAFVYLADCRDRSLLGILSKVKSAAKRFIGEETPEQKTAEEQSE